MLWPAADTHFASGFLVHLGSVQHISASLMSLVAFWLVNHDSVVCSCVLGPVCAQKRVSDM